MEDNVEIVRLAPYVPYKSEMEARSDGFECWRCGRCCSRVRNVHQIATVEEWEGIIAFIRDRNGGRWRIRCRCAPGCNHVWEGQVDSFEDLPVFFLQDIRPCPFLKMERDARGRFTGRTLCEVYPVRPVICRLYPYRRGHAMTYGCPGYGPP
jgi:Fe-S-cluster containining protein